MSSFVIASVTGLALSVAMLTVAATVFIVGERLRLLYRSRKERPDATA